MWWEILCFVLFCLYRKMTYKESSVLLMKILFLELPPGCRTQLLLLWLHCWLGCYDVMHTHLATYLIFRNKQRYKKCLSFQELNRIPFPIQAFTPPGARGAG